MYPSQTRVIWFGMYYEPNIAAAAVRQYSIARATLFSGFLSLLLWFALIAIAVSLLGR